MSPKHIFAVLFVLACCFTGLRQAQAGGKLPELDNAYPHTAKFVAPGEDLQAALKKHRSVRLGPGVYGKISLSSGQKLYGVPGSRIHSTVVEPGTTKALMWRVDTNLYFLEGSKVTKHNSFTGIGSIKVRGAVLEENQFLDSGAIDIDLTSGGYLRNNRFIRVVLQGPRQVIFRGNRSKPSYNNVFLWFNPLCPKQKPMYLEELQDITFVGVDAELWLSKSEGAMFHTGRMGTLRIFGGQGGENSAAGRAIPILDTQAKEVQIYGLTPHCPKVKPNFILREGNERLFTVGCTKYVRSIPKSTKFDFNAFEFRSTGKDTVRTRGVTKKAMRDLLVPRDRKGSPWERPSFGSIPNPAGKSWKNKLAKAPDHTAELQKRIDTEGIAVLAPGKFYISEPLRISSKHGIVGAGMDKTVIIAKNPGMSLFRADDRKKPTQVVLANLTLQGGAVGLELRCVDIGTFISRSFVSHVQFRDMSVAGIHVNMPTGTGVQSMDNNVFTRCIFYRCASGVKQTPSTRAPAGFMDKNLFFECQFVDCDYGLELLARRQNNLNSCISCLFRGCRVSAVKLRSSSTTTFANCDFIDNGGDPVITSNRSVILVSCHFKAGRTAKSLLPPSFSAEGCTFRGAVGASSCTVIRNATTTHFYNCSSDLPVGELCNGMLTNNRFVVNRAYSQPAVVVYQGQAQTIVEGKTSPSPQMLFGANLGARKEATKTRSVTKKRRRPSSDVVITFDTKLRKRLSTALASGNKVTFQPKKKKAPVDVNAIDESGKLQVTFTKSQKTGSVAFKRLSYADRLALAKAILQEDDAESHSLVAFYALCTNDRELATEHLRNSGKMAAQVQEIFAN